MPFLTECMFCHHQTQVPDHALGASGRCPKCANYFTVVPVPNLPRAARPGSVRLSAAPSGGASVQTLPAPSPSPVSVEPAATAVPLPVPVPAVFASPCEAEIPLEGRKWIEPVGVVALLLGAAALICAAVSWLCVWVIPASVLAVFAGLMGMMLAKTFGRHRLLTPVAGSGLGVLILLTALVLPGLLGPAYRSYRERDTYDPGAIRAVPLARRLADDTLPSPDWIDADRFALQQGRLRIQVASLVVGPVEPPGKAKKKDKPKEKPPEFLVLRLRVNQIEGTSEFAADPLNWSSPRNEKPFLTLTDSTGKVYAPRTVPGVRTAEEVRKSSLFPVTVVEEVFAFEPPPASVESLRLEVPVSAWGGAGVFRFTVPNTMVIRQPAAPVRGG
jgi:hypothetical protein